MNAIKNQKGFTVLELVIVLVIIGVLASVGIPKYLSMKQQADVAADRANKSTIQAVIMNRFVKKLTNGEKINVADVVKEFNSKPAKFFAEGKVPIVPGHPGKEYKAKIDGSVILVYY